MKTAEEILKTKPSFMDEFLVTCYEHKDVISAMEEYRNQTVSMQPEYFSTDGIQGTSINKVEFQLPSKTIEEILRKYSDCADIGIDDAVKAFQEYLNQLPSGVPSDEQIRSIACEKVPLDAFRQAIYIVGMQEMRERLAPMIAKFEEEKQSMQGLANELLRIKQKYGEL